MSNIEKTLKHFTSQQKRYKTQHNGAECPHYKLVIDLLDLNIPKEPCDVMFSGNFKIGNCPNCGQGVNNEYDLCEKCGQHLNW